MDSRGDRDREDRECTLFVFFILQKHKVLLLLWVYTNKSRHLIILNDIYHLFVWPVFLVYFTLILKKSELVAPAWPSTPGS